MNNALYKNTFGWGFGLWFFGYILGFIFFSFVPVHLIGWVITPIGVVVTILVLLKWITHAKIRDYALIGIAWTLIAIVCDYFFLVQLLKPVDGYYKLDVYLYYALTLILPLIVGWYKIRSQRNTDTRVV